MRYTTKVHMRGADELVIEPGGKLTLEAGATLNDKTGRTSADMANVAPVSGSTAAAAITTLNALLKQLKDSGLMVLDAWPTISIGNIAAVDSNDANATEITANKTASTVAFADGVCTISGDLADYEEFERTGAGEHLWVALEVTTGLGDITAIKLGGKGGTAYGAADVAEATACGGSAGDIVMWFAIDDLAEDDVTVTLWSSGYEETTFTVKYTDTTEAVAE